MLKHWNQVQLTVGRDLTREMSLEFILNPPPVVTAVQAMQWKIYEVW